MCAVASTRSKHWRWEVSGHNHRIETPRRRGGKEWGGGIPLPSRLGGLWERRELPQQGPGRSPGRKRIFAHLDLERTLLTTVNEMKIRFMPCMFVTCQ